jgi:hypothetical protein
VKPGDLFEVINPDHEWFGSTGVIKSIVMNEDKETEWVRVHEISTHSLPHAYGIWSVHDLKVIGDSNA